MVSSIERFHCIQDSQLGPNGVLYREVLLYTGQPAGSQWCPLMRGSTVQVISKDQALNTMQRQILNYKIKENDLNGSY